MRRRTIILGTGAALAAGGSAALLLRGQDPGEAISRQAVEWTASEFRAGGTAGLPADLPEPTFRANPQCVATLAKTLGPCHTSDVPVRRDVTEGTPGLPTRISLRIVDAQACTPIKDADVEIWHVDRRGVYSGRAAAMCNRDDEAAQAAGYLRGRQISDADGRVSFLSVYPGWYSGRTVHIHLRILIGERELLVSQLLFDDALSDMIFGGHPDYAGRPARDTMNGNDGVFSADEAESFIFDVAKLDAGILQASYTIGVSS